MPLTRALISSRFSGVHGREWGVGSVSGWTSVLICADSNSPIRLDGHRVPGHFVAEGACRFARTTVLGHW